MTQIPFQLSLPDRYGRNDFLVSASNRAALDAIERWPDWVDRVLLVLGPPGSGKTHLCHIWMARSGALAIGAEALGADLPTLAQGAMAIDGIDSLALPEHAVFHLLNLVRETRASLLLTARRPPVLWGLRTQDVLSRLRLAPAVEIAPPDEALMRAVLAKLFDDRQVRVDASLVDYLALRLDRSLETARAVVEALDAAGLSKGGRITRSLAADVLRTLSLDDD